MSSLREQMRRLSAERTETMRSMRQAGETYEAIGRRFGVSRQRVYELVHGKAGGSIPRQLRYLRIK